MLRLTNLRVLAAVILTGALVACDDTTPTGPTTPGRDPVTVTFSGTLARNGAAAHEFTPAAGGTVTATLTALGGGEEQTIGLALGNWFSGACSLVFANDDAKIGAVLTGTLNQSGPLCVRISDVGDRIASGVTLEYTIQVVHP